eukprot:CAMPEP_0175054348 /NCGR_PEP_ID=MMETSP0052_2-20121109/9454_1 /TAXON_ID=51329 ORGANISM="Polytomella parva, Strain SAG 63-3" /NCGR_SAMPLE_ID=MMETSP0052_2 /ASSEMBLY_ACC=CAM_ASM_000194 /LENGTH=446 /DNA_ID=CAMNT_0016319031 /DNA_START=142 /DNA_END=1479 /DNA_ORIENTATION=+
MDINFQLRKLQDENDKLSAALRDKNDEILSLKETLDTAMEMQQQDLQAAKIIELSKKNRTLTMNYEREKLKCQKLNQELAQRNATSASSGSSFPSFASGDLHAEVVEEAARSVVAEAAEAAEAAQREAASLRERLAQTVNKTSKLEQRVFSLEIENKKLTRALVREVGEDVPLARVLGDDGSAAQNEWRSRRELIVSLKEQVHQLKAQLGLKGERKRDVAAKATIDRIGKDRAAEAAGAAAELVAARGDIEALKQKLDASVSRRRVLENEIGGLKQKLSLLLSKGQTDDKLIAALKAELAASKRNAYAAGAGGNGGGRGNGGGAAEGIDGSLIGEETLWQELSQLRRRCGELEDLNRRQETILFNLLHDGPSTSPRNVSNSGIGSSNGYQGPDNSNYSYSGSYKNGGVSGSHHSLNDTSPQRGGVMGGSKAPARNHHPPLPRPVSN